MNDRHERIRVDAVRPGDTVLIAGELRTVCRSDLGGDSFTGRTLYGDSFQGGRLPVTRVTFGAEIARQNRKRESENEK